MMRTLRYNCAVIDQILKERPLKQAYNRSTFENDKIKMKRGSFISAGTLSDLSQIAGQTHEDSDSLATLSDKISSPLKLAQLNKKHNSGIIPLIPTSDQKQKLEVSKAIFWNDQNANSVLLARKNDQTTPPKSDPWVNEEDAFNEVKNEKKTKQNEIAEFDSSDNDSRLSKIDQLK